MAFLCVCVCRFLLCFYISFRDGCAPNETGRIMSGYRPESERERERERTNEWLLLVFIFVSFLVRCFRLCLSVSSEVLPARSTVKRDRKKETEGKRERERERETDRQRQREKKKVDSLELEVSTFLSGTHGQTKYLECPRSEWGDRNISTKRKGNDG